ncbi:coiled-coil domain-containing protein 191 isoform X2 [Oryzias latipes]|uniref:Coiled-coil domain containing 191 n=1 Tax=Oryzias latipes TaxID=8090 RepID=H2LZE1_ORYLA|nr:coiled-coil domain-containing protein 191 isoform X2 [Oryzias latipes]
MAFSGNNPHLFRWKRLSSATKKPDKNGGNDLWKKRVEMASEFAVSQVFANKKPHLGTRGLATQMHSTEQLRDHDEDYSEAQTLLSNWLSSKLRIDLEIEDEDDLMCPDEGRPSAATAANLTATFSHGIFDDFCLSDEEKQSGVNNILQELKKREVLDTVMMEKLVLDDETTPKKFTDPVLTMEARHRQVRENRLQREAEKERQHREKEARQAVRQEAKRREREREMRRKQEQHKQEELMQQELVRLRREMEQRRAQEQLPRQRKRSELHQAAANTQTTPAHLTKQQQNIEQLRREEWIQAKVHTSNFKCVQRHFCGWHSAVLERQLQMSKATAFFSWRRQLRAWRAWRAVVCAERRHRDVAKTKEELRTENRKHQLAVESDRRRLLRRCLYEWQVWCRIMREQRCILAQQQETKRKMAALLSAAVKGHLKTKITIANQQQVIQPELGNQSETSAKKDQNSSDPSSPGGSMIHQGKNATRTVSGPLQPWQVTRRHTAPTAEDFHKARQWVEDFTSSTASTGSRFEGRHAVQQQIITQQRKLLKEQQEQIARLKEEQNMKDLRLEMEKTAEEMEKTRHYAPEQRAPAGEAGSQSAPSRKAVTRQAYPHPIVSAMEARARQRAERRKEIEEVKKKKEEQKLAEMKAAEERRQQEEEEEKRQALEKRREEKRLEREREEEKQRQLKRQQELARLAHQHCNKTLLLQRGLVPWKRFIQFLKVNKELAENHHKLLLLRRCTLQWQQSARESMSERNARADLLQQHFILRRGFRCWMKLRDLQVVQEERAERFYRRHTLRRFLHTLLDYVTQERLVEWERQELAQGHNNRRVQQRCFLAWRQLPCVMRRERERNARREKLIRRVAEVLPDFHSHPL